jgi:flagellar motor switch/type III secretory pathway protein FliN
VSDSLLDAAELEAIQAAIREIAPRGRRSASSPEVEPTRLALMADDRVAEAAQPVLISLANRWVRPLTRALTPHVSGTWQVDPMSAEVIDGATAREELRGGWVGALSGTGGEVVIAAFGSVVEVAAANRTPSAMALRLFQPAGRAVLDSWGVAWREVFESPLAATSDLTTVARLIEARSVLRISLVFSGDLSGRIQVYARPEMLAPRPSEVAANKANTKQLANALSYVPVEVVAELGTLRLSLHEVRNLQTGATFTLQGFVDSRVPVYVQGVLKAWAHPVVYRGVLAVRIESIVHGQGDKS